MDTARMIAVQVGTIRLAILEDVPRLVELAWANVGDGPYKRKIAFDENIARMFIANVISDDEARVLAYEHEGKVEGMFGFTTFPNFYYFAGARVASMVIWSVSHRFRGRPSIELLKRGEEEARKLDAKHMILTGPTAQFDKLCKHCGYGFLESSHIKEL